MLIHLPWVFTGWDFNFNPMAFFALPCKSMVFQACSMPCIYQTRLLQGKNSIIIWHGSKKYVNSSSFYLWNGVSLCRQPLHNHYERLSQFYKVVSTLHKMLQPCDNLTKLQQGCYNLEISIWNSCTGRHIRKCQ